MPSNRTFRPRPALLPPAWAVEQHRLDTRECLRPLVSQQRVARHCLTCADAMARSLSSQKRPSVLKNEAGSETMPPSVGRNGGHHDGDQQFLRQDGQKSGVSRLSHKGPSRLKYSPGVAFESFRGRNVGHAEGKSWSNLDS